VKPEDPESGNRLSQKRRSLGVEITISMSEELRDVLEQRAKACGEDLKAFVESLVQGIATHTVDELPGSTPTSDAEFEADMEAFTEGTEHLPACFGTYSRPASTSIMTDTFVSNRG
jgi:hypothetical protein